MESSALVMEAVALLHLPQKEGGLHCSQKLTLLRA